MPSPLRTYALNALRAVLVGGGLFVAGGIVYGLATMPPDPPESDGFVTGAAYFFGTIVFVLALGAAGLGLALPSLLGADDPLGFGRWQCRLFKAAGVLAGGGFLLGLAFGLVTELQYGFFLWLLTVFLGILVVCLAVGWRLLQVVVSVLARVLPSGS